MRRVINSTYVSLDGVTEHPERWRFEFSDDSDMKFAREQLFASDALLMGRKTYEIFAESWPSRTGEFADKFNGMQKYVASTTMTDAGWSNSTVLQGDLVQEVRKLKQQAGRDILMYGFGPVAHTLLQHGLIDETRLWVHPVFVGEGMPSGLFREGNHAKLKLVGTTTVGTGIVILSYAPADKGAASTS